MTMSKASLMDRQSGRSRHLTVLMSSTAVTLFKKTLLL